jgi:hypothetical protein
MDDQDVIDRARAEGFELTERPVGGHWCWGFVREEDERHPAFLERAQAIDYMGDWLRRGRIFR